MSTFLKKNWFVCLMALAFACMSVYYIYDTNKGKLKGKSVDGEDVVYSINGEDVTISEFYDELYKSGGISTIGALFQRSVVNQGVETTAAMQEYAKTQGPLIEQNYMYQYPSTYKEVLGQTLQSVGYDGYDDLEQYLIDYQKLNKLTSDYAEAHFDELNIRNVSYILIKFSDDSEKTEEPNEDESTRMQTVDDALAAGNTFADVAATYSEDSSTADDGGVLGTIDKNVTSLDTAFQTAALALEEGEMTDWVYSENFGYFRIYCNASTPDSLYEFVNSAHDVNVITDETEATSEPTASAEATASPEVTVETIVEETDPYEDLANNYDTTLSSYALFAKAEELGMDFGDNSELETSLRSYFGVDTEEAE